MTDPFAVAVDAYREALARFDCPRGLYADTDPRWPEDLSGGVWVDYCGMREAAVLAEEAELEQRFGRGTKSAGGGGELRGRADGRLLPVADFRPTHVRIRDALIRFGLATTAQIAEAAGASNFTSAWLLKAEKRGDVRRRGERPRRWEWIGKRPAVNTEAVAANSDRPSVNTEPVRVNTASEGTREVMEMPKGKMGPSDEQLLDEAKTFAVSFTTDALLERLAKKHGKDAPGYETLHKRLAGLRKRGILTGGRVPGKGAPTVWAITGRDTKARPAPGLLVSAAAAKAAESLDPERGATSEQLYGAMIRTDTLHGEIAKLVKLEALRVAVTALRSEVAKLERQIAEESAA